MNKYVVRAVSYITGGLLLMALFPATSAVAFESRGNTSSAKWAYQSPGASSSGATVIYANPGDVLNFYLKIQNTSKTDVFYSAEQLEDELYPYVGAHELRVGATNDVVYANIFDFSYGGPFEHNNRFATFQSGMPVFPGKYLGFNWALKVRDDIGNGRYHFAVGVVQEFDAWLGDRPGPGAGGPNNNLGGRSGGTIFWDIVIGGNSGISQTLTNSYIGMSISYPQPYEAHGTGMIDAPATSNQVVIYKNTATGDMISIEELYGGFGWSDDFPNYSVADWADAFWQFNNNRGYTTSQLLATTVGGEVAYTFNIKDNIWITPSGMGTGLTAGVIYKVVLTYNNFGQKIVIYYTLGKADLEQIISTLQFI